NTMSSQVALGSRRWANMFSTGRARVRQASQSRSDSVSPLLAADLALVAISWMSEMLRLNCPARRAGAALSLLPKTFSQAERCSSAVGLDTSNGHDSRLSRGQASRTAMRQ